MKPYYEADGITIYHGDCREILPSLSGQALVTDPPYGMRMRDHAPMRAFSDDFSAVAALDNSPGGIAAVFMSPRRVAALLGAMPTWAFERILWMHKTADIAGHWRGWCLNSEAICIFSRPDAVWPAPPDYRSDVYSVGPWERAGHPNGKPLMVVTDLVRRLVAPDGCVIDPFAGSGTTLRAAKNLGRRAIGIEIEERYCEIAARRLDQQVLDLGAA